MKLIYIASKLRILKVADKIKNGVSCDDPTFVEPKEVEIPETKIWGFKLGDKVKIQYKLEDFRSIQRRTLGWNARLNMLPGNTGIVVGRMSDYDNSIQVFFPDVFSEAFLFAGVIEKINKDDYPSQWKFNDLVETQTSKRLIIILQQGLGLIPPQFIGKTGRVISVTKRSVEVTFDEQQSIHVHPALLKRSKINAMLKIPKVIHPRGFEIGDRAYIITNVKRLVENQKEFGGWDSDMSSLRGSEVTVLNIQEDKSLNVQIDQNRPMRVNSDSVMKIGEKEKEEQDLEVLPGDIVKIKFPRNLLAILEAKNIPVVFTEYLRLASKIQNVLEDFEYTTQFFNGKCIQIHSSLLRKANDIQAEKHRGILSKVVHLQPGDVVHLDVGPPNYVKAVLTSEKTDADTIAKLTKSATLLGFVDAKTAVIQYENGQKIKIGKNYLTVPERFFIEREKRSVDLNAVMCIQETLNLAVSSLHKGDDKHIDWKVETLSMSIGNPPHVSINITSILATQSTILNWLRQNTDWDIEDTCERQLFIQKVAGDEAKIKLQISFNDETQYNEMQTDADVVILDEKSAVPRLNKAVPFVEEPIVQQPSATAATPEVQGAQQFRYMPMLNPYLGREVYVPYSLHGPTNGSGIDTGLAYTPPSQAQNTLNVVNSTIHNLSNTGTSIQRS